MRERDSDSWKIIGGDQFDLIPNRLRFLFGFYQNVRARRATFGPFGMEGDS